MRKRLIFALLFALLGAIAQPVLAASSYQAAPPASQPQDPGRTQGFIQIANQWTHGDGSANPGAGSPQANPDLVAYLTFDDGPDPKWTPKVLALLQQYHARATFFEIGYNVKKYPDTTLQVAQAGHTIGIHGFNHLDSTKLEYEAFYSEIVDNYSIIADVLSIDPSLINSITLCFRPPYRAIDKTVINWVEGIGYELSLWDIDTNDWNNKTPDEIFSSVINAIQPYSIILMHDGGGDRSNTLQGLALVLHELTLRGYSFAPYCTVFGQAFTP
jgi:peptidoglycan/xylan/chitin deacetylase (PgdA/CDA1 family)